MNEYKKNNFRAQNVKFYNECFNIIRNAAKMTMYATA